MRNYHKSRRFMLGSFHQCYRRPSFKRAHELSEWEYMNGTHNVQWMAQTTTATNFEQLWKSRLCVTWDPGTVSWPSKSVPCFVFGRAEDRELVFSSEGFPKIARVANFDTGALERLSLVSTRLPDLLHIPKKPAHCPKLQNSHSSFYESVPIWINTR